MKNIKLTSMEGRTIFLNWDKVDSTEIVEPALGENYIKIRLEDEVSIEVKETMEEIEQKVENHAGGGLPE